MKGGPKSSLRPFLHRALQFFFAILKFYIYMTSNLILAISFGFKLNSNLNSAAQRQTQSLRTYIPYSKWLL